MANTASCCATEVAARPPLLVIFVGGQVFCVSNEDPLSIENLHYMLQSVHPKVLKFAYLPRNFMVLLAHAVEFLQWISRGRVSGEIKMLTPAMVELAGTSYVLKSSKARSILGYRPLYTVDEGVQLATSQWIEMQPKPKPKHA